MEERIKELEEALESCINQFKNIGDYGAMRFESDWLKIKYTMNECQKVLYKNKEKSK